MSDKVYCIPALKASYSGSVFAIISSIIKTYIFGYKQARRVFKKMGKEVKYDAIIYQKAIYIHLVGQLAGLVKARSYWHLPNVARTAFSKNYYNYFCRKYGIVPVANSIYTQKTLGSQCKYVIYPGYDSFQVRDSEPVIRQKLNLNPTTPIYGIAARMQKDKAQDLVVEAFVKSDVPNAGGHLVIAGGPLDSEYARQVQEQAGPLLGKQIHFLGEVKEMPAFYSSVDIAINGRRNVEPFGISIAEAMGAGKPVIAYKLGGPAEMINHMVNGWLVEHPTAEDYKDILNLSIANRANWPEMGKTAKENSKNFRIEENVDALLKIINN
jgi:glycosyltransferase involved in cell wall biosynthesis